MSENSRTESHIQNQKTAQTKSDNRIESESKTQKTTQTQSENRREKIRKLSSITTPLFCPQTRR